MSIQHSLGVWKECVSTMCTSYGCCVYCVYENWTIVQRLKVGIHLYDSSLDLSKELSKEESNEESEASEKS